ncbi:O-antigen ligase family protein [Microbacterium sp. Au-Mic1]|uniref:O-antigen ligase family protein n=1 Tax=Microbacterium sp. Au-Mic1 TaxID=2906457 RepID=UPI001E3B43AC|nr:O-antigen ligase family protein [Microbacterium sp. Au-Mic1]MCE4025712.1 O-antigen ligase family protein [Microbacterium sp. Au-Mic1]
MTTPRRRLARTLASVEMARAYTTCALLSVFGSFAISAFTSSLTLNTIIAVLCVIGIGILWVRREELTPLRIAPSTLLAFLAWTLASAVWSTASTSTLKAWAALAGYAVIAVVVGHIRDTLQTVRALGDALRILLGASLVAEIMSGILLDMPFHFLGIQGEIAAGGPIQGLFGTRNMLGLIAVIAVITFVVEWRSQSLSAAIAIPSVVLAGFLALFSASPTVLVLAAVVGAASVALVIVRQAPVARRRPLQWAISGVVLAALATAAIFRSRIIALLDAGSDFNIRVELWSNLLTYVQQRPAQGWGWFGLWSDALYPFNSINYFTNDHHGSALNAYFDVLLQVGAGGLLLFCLLGGIALVRSWLVASVRRSVVYAWAPLVLVALAVDSVFESFTIVGAGWFLLVLCALRAGQSRSWRENIDAVQTSSTPLPDH